MAVEEHADAERPVLGLDVLAVKVIAAFCGYCIKSCVDRNLTCDYEGAKL